MFVIVAAAVGAVIGAVYARKLKGNRADIAQYAAVFAVIFAILGLFANMIILRMI